MAERGVYTEEFTQRLNRQDAQTMAATFLAKAHPNERAVAQATIASMEKMSPEEKERRMVELNRGSNGELLAVLAVAIGGYGAGKLSQTYFPYTILGNIPAIPAVAAVAGTIYSLVARRPSSVRFPLAVGAITFGLGASSLTGPKL